MTPSILPQARSPELSLPYWGPSSGFIINTSLRCLIGSLLLWVGISTGVAQGPRLRLEGLWPGFVWGRVTAIVVDGDRGYAAVQQNEISFAENSFALVLFNLSNPAIPVRLGSYPTVQPPVDICPVGDLVYMLNLRNDSYGLDILDVSIPSFPILRGRLEIPEVHDLNGFRIRIAGHYAFVSVPPDHGPGFLNIVDIIDPEAPILVFQYALAGVPTAFDLQGNKLYVAEESADIGSNDFWGFEILDVSDAAKPVRVGAYNNSATLGAISDIHIVGSYAYLAGWNLEIVDVSSPAHPIPVGGYPTEGAWNVRVANAIAYVSGTFWFGPGLEMFDLSSPTNPILIGFFPLDEPQGIAFLDNLAYLAAGDEGLLILDVSDPSHPSRGDAHETLKISAVYLNGHYAYAETPVDLAILDVSNPIQPRRVGSYPSARMLHVNGDRGFVLVADTNAIEIVDTSNPTNLMRLGVYATDLRIDGLQILGDRAYISQFSGHPTNLFGFELVDVSDPSHPVRLNSIVTNGVIRALQVSGHYAFVADSSNTLRVLDISNFSQPTTVAIYNSNGPPPRFGVPVGALDLALVSNVVYVAAGDGIHIVDVRNPWDPRGIYDAFFDLPIHGVHARNGYVGFSMNVPGPASVSGFVFLEDIRNPASPTLAGALDTHKFISPAALDVLDGHFYLGDGPLRIFEIQQPPSLHFSGSVGNMLRLDWQRSPGMHLEMAPSVDAEWWMWREVPGSDGKSNMTLSKDSGKKFFRLAQP